MDIGDDLAVGRKRLRKVPEWWIWGGFLTLTRAFGVRSLVTWEVVEVQSTFHWRYTDGDDPMDAWDFNEEAAFPYLKPDIDVYGVPLRSRKQRGWYHIHQHPCQICSTSLPLSTPETTSTAVTSLPAEVVQAILKELKNTKKSQDGDSVRATGPALVCRHWARVCLEGLWKDSLHGRDHVMTLRTLVSSPHGYLKRSIGFLHEMSHVLDGKSDPWLHLVPNTRDLLPNYRGTRFDEHQVQGDTLSMVGPLGSGLRTMRSIHAHLPQQLPPSFSLGIHTLTLQNIRFRLFSDLEHVLSELPTLELFKGTCLSWERMVNWSRLPWRRMARGATYSQSPWVQLNGCQRNVEAVTLIADPQNEHWIILQALLEYLLPMRAETTIAAKSLSSRHITPVEIIQYLQYSVTFQLDDEQERLRPRIVQVNSSRLARVQLAVQWFKSPQSWVWVDWKALDQAIMTYPHLESVTFCDYISVSSNGVTWKPTMDVNDRRFIQDKLPDSFAAGKASFVKPDFAQMLNG